VLLHDGRASEFSCCHVRWKGEIIFPDRKDRCSFTMDERANSLAVMSDGKVRIVDVASKFC